MNIFIIILLATVIMNSFLAGASLDQTIKQLPSRRKIGVIAFSSYSRASDLHNGVPLYATLGIGSALLTVFTFILSLFLINGTTLVVLLSIALILTICHSAITAIAAPLNFSQVKAGKNKKALAEIFDKFEFLQSMRAMLQVTALIVLVWALITSSSPAGLLTLILIITTAVAGIAASATLDQSAKQLPSRHIIGVLAYSDYSMTADKVNGMFWYIPLAAIWLIMVIASIILGMAGKPSPSEIIAYSIMAACAILHLIITAFFAGPILLSQDKFRGKEKALRGVFDRFAFWNFIRLIIDFAVLISAAAALIFVRYK